MTKPKPWSAIEPGDRIYAGKIKQISNRRLWVIVDTPDDRELHVTKEQYELKVFGIPDSRIANTPPPIDRASLDDWGAYGAAL